MGILSLLLQLQPFSPHSREVSYSLRHSYRHSLHYNIISTMGARLMMSFGIYSSVILLLSGINPIVAQDCDMDCFMEHANKHISFGTPVGGVMTLCECRDLCHDDDACIGFDFNREDEPYQSHSCWLYYEEGDLIWPSMEVNHYMNTC